MKKNNIIRYLSKINENIHPGFSIDCVILSFHEDKFKVLLNKYSAINVWMLPGGYMLNNDLNSDIAAHRILKNRTGISDSFLQQFYLFTDKNRVNKDMYRTLFEEYGISEKDTQWLADRFVSLGYFSLVQYNKVNLIEKDEDVSAWFDVNNLPPLFADHKLIIEKAIDNIRLINEFIPIGFGLLPDKFTISELRRIHEVFNNEELDRRNFQKRVLATEFILKLEERRVVNTYPHPILFTYNASKMEKIMKRSILPICQLG